MKSKKATIEMSKLIVFILVVILLIFLMVWYGYLAEGRGGLGDMMGKMLDFM